MTDEEKVGVAADTTLVDQLASEAEELDGYFSDAPLDPVVNYPPLHEGMECAVVITNLPKVPSAKVEKLYKIVLKIVSKLGTLQEQPSSSSVVDAKANETDAGDEEGAAAEASAFSGCLIPVDADGATLGFCFVEYDSPETAQNCVNVLTNYKFDKNHSLNVVPYERAKYLSTIPTETFVEPTPAPFVEKPNATTWLEDANQRDQFVTRYGKETVVHWFDGRPNNDPVVAYDGTQANDAGLAWCDYYCHFSPAGSYFATLVVPRGVILWSGETFQKTGRFAAREYLWSVLQSTLNIMCHVCCFSI